MPWLGEIPADWEVRKLKYASDINSEALPEDTSPDLTLQYVDIGNVDSNGNILDVQEMQFENAPSRARRKVRGGDTIISTVRTYLKAIAYIDTPSDNLIVSTGFAVLRPTSELEPKFLWRLVQSQGFVDTVVAHSEGIGYPAIAPTKLAELPVWIPSPPEQRAIAAFLDRETAKLDTLTRKFERLIEVVQEQRAALISHAVTKGIPAQGATHLRTAAVEQDACASEATWSTRGNTEVRCTCYKDSGIPSLGEIPAHWEVKQVRYIAESLQTGPFGSQLHSSDYVTSGTPVINPSHMIDGRIEPDWDVAIDDATLERLARHQLRAGDIVFARRGELGRCALVTNAEEGWLCGTGSLRMRPLPEVVDSEYLNTVLSTKGVAEWLLLQSVGSTMDNLNTSILARLPLPIPPLPEQRAIAAHLDRETAKLDALIAKTREAIARLAEYRTALISAAVTGKIDVRGAV
ncbi:MAG: restriction endonuclease subunit S [Anaerolineae bacterium]|nr:restriction endonuclease subunit S [Anaerolineae bacterium]